MTFLAFGTVISCWYVFSGYKGEDDFFLHPPPFFASLYVFSDYNRVDSILCCIRQHHAFVTFRACLFWRHFVASATIICFYVCLFWLQKRGQRRGWLFLASATIFCFFVCCNLAIVRTSKLETCVSLLTASPPAWHAMCVSADHKWWTLPHFWQEHPFVAYVRGIRACSLVSLDILCVSSDHNIHTEHFRMSRCHASRRTCFCDTKRLCVCTAHSSWLSSRHVISLPKKFRSLRHVDLGACGFSAPASEMSSPF